tara:strand:+ start:124 stop:303 length:180 start_codon:yes stop_codon:yes gene_type:complete
MRLQGREKRENKDSRYRRLFLLRVCTLDDDAGGFASSAPYGPYSHTDPAAREAAYQFAT